MSLYEKSCDAMMKFKAIIFDLDNTLLIFGSNVDWENMRKDIVKHYLKNEIPVEVVTEYRRPLLLYARMFDYGKKYLSQEKIMRLQQEANEIIEKFELQVVNRTMIIPGSIEVLKWVRKRGMKIGVVTLQGRKATQKIMQKIGIHGIADAVFYRDSPGRPKPYPDHLLGCLKELNCNSDEAIFVGDNTSDMLAAKTAGIYAVCVNVHRDYLSEEELKAAGAERLINSINELPNVIKELE